MRRFLIILGISIGSYTAVIAQPLPRDVATIEALISGHKKIWNSLQKRNQNEAVNLGMAANVSSLSQDYQNLRDLSFKRIEQTYTILAFTKDATDVFDTLIDIGKILPKFIELASSAKFKYPLLNKYYMNTYYGVKTEIEGLTNILRYAWTWNGTVKERYDQIRHIKASLEIIKSLLDKVIWMGEGIVALGTDAQGSWMDFVKQQGLDKQGVKIAKEIIAKYKTGFK